MDADPLKRWQVLKLRWLRRLPGEPRKKIKRLMQRGDEFMQLGQPELGEYCYQLSRELAQEAGTIHLLKKLEQRVENTLS
ncbi:MAG: hypothetical protein QM392_08500 [Bacillota bacterium]|jgi:hypothetical protein|nr:hypothetical protein [Bacillota bacterium]